jgi:phosphatidylglycerol lysyltransferase
LLEATREARMSRMAELDDVVVKERRKTAAQPENIPAGEDPGVEGDAARDTGAGTPASRAWRAIRSFRPPGWAAPLVSLLFFCIAIYVIHNELAAHNLQQIASSLKALSPLAVAGAAVLAALSYAALGGGEAIALSMMGRKVSAGRVALASFTAYALGNAVGFSFATAPAIRARLYRDALKPGEIAAISAVTGAGMAASAAAAAGLGLLFAAPEIARHSFNHPWIWRVVGAALVAPALAWLAFSFNRPRPSVTLAGVTIGAPPSGLALIQVALGVLDWASAAGCLYLLLPEHGGWSFPAFVAVFVISGVLGAASGAPGGIGVFEAGILTLAPASQHVPGALAALVVYRFLYTLGPLGIAAVLLAADAASDTDLPAVRTARRLGGALQELAPQIFAVLAFACGALLLLSAATPAVFHRVRALAHVAPLFVVELSHFLASVVGALLLVVAAGLRRKSQGAYVATMFLLALGAVFAVAKGGDIEEAIVLSATGFALAFCRPAFTRRSRLLSEPLSLPWLVAIIGVVAAVGWIGLFSYREVAYSDELWWTFLMRDRAGVGDASRFLRGAVGVGVVVALAGLWSLFSVPRTGHRGRPSSEEVERAARAIAGADDMQADAWLALLGDKDLFFSPSGKSFIMFRVRGRRWIAMSEPCGLKSERHELLWRFAEAADEAGAAPVFYSVSTSMLPDSADLGLAVRKIGETAIVGLEGFCFEGKPRAILRHARNRIEREGGSFEMLPPGGASAYAEELEKVSNAWLTSHGDSEKGFSLGRFDLGYLDRTPLAIVRVDGEIVAFANVWGTRDKRELSVDLMRYSEAAPKTVMDYLFAKLMEWGAAEGFQELDLGMAPLAGLPAHRLAPALSRIGAALYAEGERVYGFKGLRAYKEKFNPQWRPLYIAAPPSVFMPLALLDVALVTSGGWRGML